MSVPPLVCSTPPPPDHIDEIVYNDEFSLHYEEPSPTHQYDSRGYSFNDPLSGKEVSSDDITSSYVQSAEKSNAFQTDKIESNADENVGKNDKSPGDPEKLPIETDIEQQQDDFKVDDITNHIIEDNGIEDLDLKLDSLQLDFQNARESVEDTLNSTFDDFGTFLSSNTPNDSLDNSIYLPIPGLTDSKSEKPSKLHDISSDGSFSPANGDNSDSEIGWENIPDSLNENTDLDNISTDVPDIFFDTTVVYPDTDKDLADNICNELQENINVTDTCQTLTDSSISNNDEYTIDTQFEPINSISESKNFDKNTQFAEHIIYDIKSDTYNEYDIKNTEAVTTKIPIEINVNLDNIEPVLEVDFDPDAFSSFNIASDLSINIQALNITEEPDDSSVASDVLKTEEKSTVDDDFDDFAAFQTDTDLNLFPDNVDIEFISNLEQSQINDRDIDISDNDKSVLKSDSTKDDISQSDNDDFGDFDTYNPSCEPVQMEVSESNQIKSSGSIHMTEFCNSNDTEIYEKLCTVVNEIFPAEDSEGDNLEDCELNMALGESWKHLKDYETEQSYLFQWNNSASQKSLLKSLGIDSRNILFGPKWNTNMPRFAANLGVSPLQPIRQISNSMSDYRTDDRTPNEGDGPVAIASDCKENDWENATTLSTADLQASSYAESLLLDLEHLMATLDQMTCGQSAHFKISDLFNNAIERGEEHTNIPHSCEHVTPPEQPSKSVKNPPHPTMLNIGRQINLPETHIFTPTDSETPWSHTIHYNDIDKTHGSKIDDITNISHVMKVESIDGVEMDAFENFSDFQSHSNSFGIVSKSSGNTDICDFDFVLNENPQNTLPVAGSDEHTQTLPFVDPGTKEIDDFGDFHSAEALKQVSQPTPTSVQPLHVLEPVKVTPSVPVVNWPAPGDIKSSAFEEFTDIPAVAPLQPMWDDDKINKPEKLFSSAPTFILKESKITSECFIGNNVVDNPAPKANILSSDFDEFTDFQSVPETMNKMQPTTFGSSFINQTNIKESSPISSIDLNKNISFESQESVENTPNDDFDDFQSVEYKSAPTASKETPKYTYSLQSFPRQEFVPKYQDSYQSSTFTKNTTPKPLGFPIDQYNRTPLQPISVQQTEDHAQKNTSHQILQPLSLESYSQINWPDPGIDLQDLSRFNPINSIQSYTEPKESSTKNNNSHGNSQSVDDDGWCDFVSIKPASQNINKPSGFSTTANNHSSVANTSMEDSEDWSDFVSGAVLPSRNYNELKTISQNIHSQANNAAPFKYKGVGGAGLNPAPKTAEAPPSITVLPHLSYSTPKTSTNRKYNNHFQNL